MSDSDDASDQHSRFSVLRERILEHVFIGDVLKLLWQRGVLNVEVLRSEYDAGGYDIVLGAQQVLRHIQFKSTLITGKAANVSVSLRLAEKPSGCVVWMIVDPDLTCNHYLWFGAQPGKPLPDLDNFKTTKHTKANAEGVKLERPNHRLIPRGQFTYVKSLSELLVLLWGSALEHARLPNQLEDAG